MDTKRKLYKRIVDYLIIAVIGMILLFPIIWMVSCAFKSNEEIFGSIKLLPKSFSFQYFVEGWKGVGRISYSQFFINTFVMVIPTTLFTIFSSVLVAYGFTRFDFKGKKVLFALLIAMLMLPNAVVIIPRYTLYNRFGWVDSYMPFYIPGLLCCNSFFPYMLIQFLRSIPKELDESAYIDGCGTLKTLVYILLPLMKTAIFSMALFQFLWTYNDYFNALIFINSVRKYPISLALRLSLDSESVVQWGKIMAMSTVAVLPVVLLFFSCQKYFVDGITAGAVKG
ncbi:MAG: carbohydrate ABC transporter permease [Butyrivibrio sp.]|nr:carbohydrate ABC transporter permease [Butyrivibrio sp.]